MKLRIKGNSIRLRKVRPEVARLIEDGRVDETIRFSWDADATMTYALVADTTAREIHVRYQPREITIVVPFGQAERWANSGEVGIYSSIDVGVGGLLDLIIEKDFPCLDRSDADNEDTFPNPLLGVNC